MSLKLKKVNNIKITPLINQKFNEKTVHGFRWFANPYGNIALIARTKSGKTNCIYRCLENTLKPKTNVMIFCPSINTDQTYKKMKGMLKKKKCNVKCFENFQEKGINHLNILVNELSTKEEKKEQKNESRDIQIPLTMDEIMFTNHPSVLGMGEVTEQRMIPNGERMVVAPKKAKKKKGKLAPEWVVIIDDLSSLCRDPSITRLLCRSRHLKMRIFISLHSITDLQPAAFGQLANIMLFQNINEERIEQVADKCGLTFRQDTKKRRFLCELYDIATATPYSFLNCDTQNMTFRKNFDEEFDI